MIEIKAKSIIWGAGAALALAGVVALAIHSQAVAVRALPPSREMVAGERAPNGADWVGVLGTGSMRPYIPAGDPLRVVAWVRRERVPFDSLRAGDLVLFRHERAGVVVHQLATLDAGGWSTGGLGNARYDSGRVTAANFLGRVVETLIIKP